MHSNKKLNLANFAFSTDIDKEPDHHVMGELESEEGQGEGRYEMIFCARGIIMDAKESNKNAELTHAQVLYVE